MSFLDKLNSKVAAKRTSQQNLAETLGQSPTKTESTHLYDINITRFQETYVHDQANFQKQLDQRIAWQIATLAQRHEIMDAIITVAG